MRTSLTSLPAPVVAAFGLALAIAGCQGEDAARPGTGAAAPAASGGLRERVRKVVAEHFERDAATVPTDTPLDQPPLGADELDVVEIVMELEETFDVTISDEALPGESEDAMKVTIDQLASIVERQQGAAKAGR